MADGIMKKLPEDVVIHILLRLPVKSLMRFKCNSKKLYDLIQSSIFISLHRNRTVINDELILFKRSIKVAPKQFKNVLSFLSSDNDDLKPVFPDLSVPRLTSTKGVLCYEIIGPCCGLIALTDHDVIVLFNPATRNYRALPSSPFTCPPRFRRSTHGGIGFGFDLIANDYKFVKISEIYRDPPQWDPDEDRERKVEIYDLHINSWRELDHVDQQLPNVHWFPCFEILYKGAFHWYAYADTKVILCFDMTTETFRNIKMPDTCHFYDGKRYSLVVLDDSLTLICYAGNRTEIDPIEDMTDIWILKEYGVNESWIKKYTIRPLYIETPLVVWKDHLLLLQSISGILVSYDLNSDKFKEFNSYSCARSLRVIIYKESLTPIPKVEETVEQNSHIFEKWRKAEDLTGDQGMHMPHGSI